MRVVEVLTDSLLTGFIMGVVFGFGVFNFGVWIMDDYGLYFNEHTWLVFWCVFISNSIGYFYSVWNFEDRSEM